MTDREAQLEEQVRILAAGLGLPADDPTQVVPAEVVELVGEGQEVQAVKALRDAAGGGLLSGRLGLVEAKRIVDALGRT